MLLHLLNRMWQRSSGSEEVGPLSRDAIKTYMGGLGLSSGKLQTLAGECDGGDDHQCQRQAHPDPLPVHHLEAFQEHGITQGESDDRFTDLHRR